MNKRELKKWVEQKKEEALSEVNQKWEKEKEKLRMEIAEEVKFKELVSELYSSNKEFFEKLEDWKDSVRGKNYIINVSSGRYNIIGWLGWLSSRNENDIVDELVCENVSLYKHPKFRTLENQRQNLYFEINKNYDNVLYNMSICKNAKEATAYLKSLGFELPDDDKEAVTSLAVPINVQYLIKK